MRLFAHRLLCGTWAVRRKASRVLLVACMVVSTSVFERGASLQEDSSKAERFLKERLCTQTDLQH